MQSSEHYINERSRNGGTGWKLPRAQAAYTQLDFFVPLPLLFPSIIPTTYGYMLSFLFCYILRQLLSEVQVSIQLNTTHLRGAAH